VSFINPKPTTAAPRKARAGVASRPRQFEQRLYRNAAFPPGDPHLIMAAAAAASASAAGDETKAIEIFKIKKLINSLDRARG